jgi:hypothetical protein
MKISRRRFTQFLSGLFLAPLAPVVKPVQALSDGDKGLLTKLSLDQMEDLSPSAPGLFPVMSDTTAGNDVFVYWEDVQNQRPDADGIVQWDDIMAAAREREQRQA